MYRPVVGWGDVDVIPYRYLAIHLGGLRDLLWALGKVNMRSSTRILGLFFFATTTCWRMLPAFADPGDILESTSAEPILPDPLPYTGTDFSAASATEGSADPGPALEGLYTDNRGCSARNPCAMPPPALTTSGRIGLYSVSKENPVPKQTRSDPQQ